MPVSSFRRAPAAALPLLGVLLLAVSGCSVGVPDPAAPAPATSTWVPAPATPTVTPGHDADAVAARDLPFSAGESLAAGVPVQLSDGLKDAPGWSAAGQGTAGASIYKKADGCQAAARVSTNQGPLAVPGNDKASTEALFHYLDPSILPGYLATDTLRWGGDADKTGPRVEVLVYDGAAAGTRAAVSYARMFAKAGSSVYVSVACPDRGSLAAARADVAARLAVLPPSS
ncbi:hypothetical protein [Arthrobacter sp. NPDC080082]|uniref:hypothetical protein n=1 Tax=unclassified Arthrobacter TaxID=235627 RepID=UPI00342AE6B8